MARYIDPVCRLCRREGMKLFLKGERCYNEKCAIERRNYAPASTASRRIQDRRLRPAASREAEGQAYLRSAREPVPHLLRKGRGHDRASPATTCSASSSAGSITLSTAWASPPAAPRRARLSATATSRSTAASSTSLRTRCARATSFRFARRAARTSTILQAVETPPAAAFRPGWQSIRSVPRHGHGSAEARRHRLQIQRTAHRRTVLEVIEPSSQLSAPARRILLRAASCEP